ncbi:flagellar protein FlaG [SAR92 clade bacterium H246]
MSGNEISINVGAQVTPQPSAAHAAKAGNAQNITPVKPEPSISAEDVGRAAAARKGESIQQINEAIEHLDDAIEALNAAVKKVPTSLHFSIDDASNRFVVQVTDTNTGEIIRKVPGDAILRIARQIESLKGVLFDDKF